MVCSGQKRNTYTLQVETFFGKLKLGKLRKRWRDRNKITVVPA
jgi:hypothetical protein